MDICTATQVLPENGYTSKTDHLKHFLHNWKRHYYIYIYETSSSSSSPLLFVNPEISYELNKKKHCLQGTDGNGDHPTTTFEQLAEVACSLFWGLPGFPFLGTGWVVIWTKTFSSNVVNGKNTTEFEGTCVQSWCSHIKMFKLFWVTIVYNQSIIRCIWRWQQRLKSPL